MWENWIKAQPYAQAECTVVPAVSEALDHTHFRLQSNTLLAYLLVFSTPTIKEKKTKTKHRLALVLKRKAHVTCSLLHVAHAHHEVICDSPYV